MIYGVVCGPQIAARAGLSYAKAQETKIEVTPERSREILSGPSFEEALDERLRRVFPRDLKRVFERAGCEFPKKLPRGVHPAGKFRRPKV